ncbi:hypothetical protein [Edaphovirga cremea]|uniref:hypothetical protein n=1 Tax=Edaphovirga cremea TaxID=2267246 RepID=UPI000DEF9B9F|nr:hypothetical protein [Edaphovirga cremea]
MHRALLFKCLGIAIRIALFIGIFYLLTPINATLAHYDYMLTDTVVDFYRFKMGFDFGDHWDMEELTFFVFATTAVSIIAVVSIAVLEAAFSFLMSKIKKKSPEK